MRVLLVWEHATAGDHVTPDTEVLALTPDPRVIQFWDPHRVTSHAMMRELPHDLGYAMADTTGGSPPLIWDIALVYGPGARWGERIPAPSYFATPVADSIDGFRAALARTLIGKR
jgi:hypothetical protein